MAKSKTYGVGARRMTQERVHRLAYDFEAMARRAREGGFERLANSLTDVSGQLGDLARNDDAWELSRG